MRHREPLLLCVAVLVLAGCSRDPEEVKLRFLALGGKYFDRGKYAEAAILYRKALERDRLFGEAYYRLGLTELELDNSPAATSAFRRAFELQPTNTDAFEKLAELHLEAMARPGSPRRFLSDLIQLTERAEAHNPDSFEVIRIKGLVTRFQGESQAAVSLFRRALEIRPADPRTILALGETLLASGQTDQAEQLAESFLQRDKTFGRMYDLLYAIYTRQNRVSEAEAVLRAKTANNPGNPDYLIDLAAHYHRMNQRDEMDGVLARLTGSLEAFPEAHEILGDFYLRIGEARLAIEHYRRSRNASADRDRNRQLADKIVVALTSAHQWEEASGMVEQMLEEDPRDPGALSLWSALRLRTGDREQIRDAVGDLEDVVRRSPNNAVLRFRLGEAHLANGDVLNAGFQFREALRLEPDYLLPKYALMRIHLDRNEFTQTTVMAEQILVSYPRDPTATLARATARIGLREYERARADLEQLLQWQQHEPEATFQLARLDVAEKDYQQAEQRLLRLTGSDSLDQRAWQELVDLYLAMGAVGKARQLLEARVQQAPEQLDLRLAVARLTAQHGDSDRAIAELDYVLSKDPDHGLANVLLGNILLQRGKIAAARRCFLEAIESDPPTPEAFVQLGTLLAREGRFEQARLHLERSLELSPENPAAMNSLARILAETGTDLNEALTLAQRARARDPDNPDFADTLGWVYLEQGLNDSAVEILSQIVARNPSRVEYRCHLALALHQKGDHDQASRQLAAALANKPSAAEERKIRELLSRLGS